jgi:protein-S-isoprenylcysteine O-methyltransferase Ste14
MRLFTIGAVYFCGFFFGNLITGLLGVAPEPAAMEWGRHLGPYGARILLGAGFALAAAAWALRVWGGAYLRPDVVWNQNALGDRLLVDGPLRYVRNPLYLANVLLAAGAGLLAPPIGFAIVVAGNLLVVLGLMRVETRVLRERYGATFDAYAAAVPALLPRLTPAHVSGTARVTPSPGPALRSEFFSAAIALALLLLSILLPVR